jgi:putative addiction module killer protein
LEATPREIRILERQDGSMPFSDWMESIEHLPAYGVIMTKLDRMAEGNLTSCHSVGKGVSELVIDFGPGWRVYFGYLGEETIVLLWGGTKKTQQGDIALAHGYWEEFNAEKD